MFQFYTQNKFLLYLLIGLTVVSAQVNVEEEDDDDDGGLERMDPTQDQCITSEGGPGVCLEQSLCPQSTENSTKKCDDGLTLCCPISKNMNESDDRVAKTGECGIRQSHKDLGFIVGGTEASPHSHPWAAAVFFNGRFICGATIISEKYVLCAAHCILDTRNSWKYRIKVGSHELNKDGHFADVKTVKAHERYDSNLMDNDISLFELTKPLDFSSKHIAPVCLPDKNAQLDEDVGLLGMVVGWGTMYSGGHPSDVLMQVQVPVVSNVDCITSYIQMITDHQLCAGYQNGGRDSCQGDSGGSLCREINKRYVQIGVVSWGYGCAEPGYPGVYTRVSKYIDWINTHTHKI